jgi:uncharacterized protein YneF (UPF0154 family)
MTSAQALQSEWIMKFSDDEQLQRIDFSSFQVKVDYVKDATPVSDKTIQMMKTYGNSKKMKKETLKIFVNQLTEAEISKLQAKFYEIDTDHNGMITLDELKELMGRLGYKATQNEIEKLVKNMHVDRHTGIHLPIQP